MFADNFITVFLPKISLMETVSSGQKDISLTSNADGGNVLGVLLMSLFVWDSVKSVDNRGWTTYKYPKVTQFTEQGSPCKSAGMMSPVGNWFWYVYFCMHVCVHA